MRQNVLSEVGAGLGIMRHALQRHNEECIQNNTGCYFLCFWGKSSLLTVSIETNTWSLVSRVARSKWIKNAEPLAKNAKSLHRMPNKLKQAECCWFWYYQVSNLAKTQWFSWTRR